MCIFLQQSNNLLHVQFSWKIPSGIEKNKLSCMGCFSEGKMQRHPLFHGYMFSSLGLHARRNSEASQQASIPLDSWHAHHNLDVIKTLQPNAAKLIAHINLVAMTSHIISRRNWHVQLNCFGVSVLRMPCVTFMSLFLFFLVGVPFS